MKARVKATGENIEVMQVYEKGESFYVRLDMLDTIEVRYHISELEFEGFETEGKFAQICLNGIKQDIDNNPDYWTRLEHQYAGMAMQGLSEKYFKEYRDYCAGFGDMDEDEAKGAMKDFANAMTNVCYYFAHALVEKMKEERK